ncbi:MAG: DNA polymerase I [Thermoanaerobaculia bacterium]
MPEGRPRLYLIDGYSNIFRAFYAIRHLSNSKGEPTNAVFGFVQMLRKLLRDEQPDLIGVALDVSHRTVRTEKFEDYKANRTPMPEELRGQIPQIRQALEAHRIPILEMENYEADDVLGSLARKGAAEGYDVILVSADKDLMQLVDEHVFLMHTGRNKLYDPAGVEDDFGVPPNQVVEVLALKGDSVDNVPGVPGIGEKGAIQLIRDHGTVENLLERAEELKRKSYREGLQQNRELALLSKELVTIHTDLPLDFEPDELRHEEPDNEALKKLFRELEFFSLVDELEAGGPAEDIPAATAILTAEQWSQHVDAWAGEISLAVIGDPPVGLAASAEESEPVFADFTRSGVREAVRESLDGWFRDESRQLVGHDLKEVLRLVGAQSTVKAALLDTMLISYVLRPASRAHALEEVALERLGQKLSGAKEVGLTGGASPQLDDTALLAYAGEQVVVPQRLLLGLMKELGDGDLCRVYREIEAPLIPVLMRMEENGILLDRAFLEEMSRQLGGELDELRTEIFEVAGEEFNINSPQQLGVILFEKLGYPVIKKTRKTKSYATGADILQQLALQGFPLPELILRYRELSKLKSTYVDALPALVAEDGRLHTRYEQAVAVTGRLSSVNPNLQNIPVRTGLGQRIRKAFVAADDHLLLVADYNQIELRVLAHIAEETALVEAFESGEDIHRATAAAVFGVAPELVTVEQRRAAKTINFGIIYGISAFGLGRNLGIHPSEAEVFIQAYFERYPGVRHYMDETLASAAEEGKVETLYGRVRWLPEIQARNRNLRENAQRMAINARIQGTAADLLKKAMVTLDEELRRQFPTSRLLLTVHDELVLEVPSGDLESVSELVRETMEGVEQLRVPLVVDVGSGPTWFDAKA